MRGVAGAPGLPRAGRLRRAGEFQAVFQEGSRVERRNFIALWRPTPGSRKVGFTVSRQVRGAVARNRIKRRLREAYRLCSTAVAADIALVFVGRPAVSKAPFADIVGEIHGALGAIGRRLARQGDQGARGAER